MYIARDGVTRRERDNLLTPAGKERIGTDKERAGAPQPQGGEGGVDLARGTGMENKQLPPKHPSGLLRVARVLGFRIIRVHHHGEDSGVGNKFVQQPQCLAAEPGTEPTDPRDVAARAIKAGDEAGLNGIAT